MPAISHRLTPTISDDPIRRSATFHPGDQPPSTPMIMEMRGFAGLLG
jgi:hypothetical protein